MTPTTKFARAASKKLVIPSAARDLQFSSLRSSAYVVHSDEVAASLRCPCLSQGSVIPSVARNLLLFLILGLLVAPPASAQRTGRAKTLGKRLMCMCGCNQVLTECNHVGCSKSTAMLAKLDQLVARNESDDLTLQAFVQEYGALALAEPPARGFNLLAWLMPALALLMGLVLVRAVLLRWRHAPATAAAGMSAGVSSDLLARARLESDEETED